MASGHPSEASDPLFDDVRLEEMLATRMGVSGISVHGAERTRQSFLEYILAPTKSPAGSREPSFEETVNNVSEAVDRLRSTGCFKGVDAYIDRDQLENAAAHVTFTVAEKSLYQLRTGTSVEATGGRDASFDGSLVWRNIFGKAETLSATAGWWGGVGGHRSAFGTSPSNSLDLDFRKPFFPFRRTSFFTRIGQSLRNHEDWSSYSLNMRFVEAGFDTPLGRISAQSAWRDVCDIGDNASTSVRDDAGHSLKTSLMHRLYIDRRDDPLLPTEGLYCGVESEVANGDATPGHVSFAKCEASANVNLPLGASGIAVALTLRGGVVRPGAADSRVRICDRFHIGGANSLRGFRPRGVGPRDADDALGGETFYIATAMVSVPTPESSLFHQVFGARLHAFVTAGDVGSVKAITRAVDDVRRSRGAVDDVKATAERIANSARVAAGVGIAGETAIGRVEVNLCNILRAGPDDRPKPGVQFGITQSFL